MSESNEPKLSPEVMKALGFKETWPAGNPTEPWWKHENDLFHTFFKAPTASELFKEIAREASYRGRREVQTAIKKALNA
ncbi:hypothetical protein [Dyella telluris]|uniref:Uncharacterized protein n=1 Tax=Dyella telluris TaxID=2763498 RepID=A0A7G8Q4J2_9GAMM|nr:hypothetical protein [Dyella telluris]QNK01700.1 hypothetical protein H8F01_00525 [Dyella telluris]